MRNLSPIVFYSIANSIAQINKRSNIKINKKTSQESQFDAVINDLAVSKL